MMKKIILSVLIISLAVFCVFAEDSSNSHDKGDAFFSGKLGASFPVLEFYPSGTDKIFIGPFIKSDEAKKTTGLNIGGYASLGYSYYLKSNLAVGGEVGYAFHGVRENGFKVMLAYIPITAKVSYVAFNNEKFELLLNANAGASVLKYSGNTQVCPCISLSVNPVFFINENWGIGLDAGVHGIGELYFKTSEKTGTCLALMAPVTLNVTYRR